MSFSGMWARNGSLVAEHDGRRVGSLEFQTATAGPDSKSAC
jgi:hypothetical protein